MSIIKNPQVRFDGYSPKEYLFPKYPGKFYVQAQKLKDIKVVRNYMPHKLRKEVKYANQFEKDEYKEMKAETDYIKRIQELKKKLEKQIKRYNKEKKSNQDFVRSLSLSIDRKSSMTKLEEICVNMRGQREGNQSEMRTNSRNKDKIKLQRKRYPQNINRISIRLNKSEIKNRSITQHQDKSNKNHLANHYYYKNKTERLSNSQIIKLPSVSKRELSLDPRSYLYHSSENRLSLLSEIDRLTLACNRTPLKKLSIKETELLKYSPENQHSPDSLEQIVNSHKIYTQGSERDEQEQQTHRRRFMFSLSDKYSAKKYTKRYVDSEEKPKQNENNLKGWEVGPQKGFNDQDSIY